MKKFLIISVLIFSFFCLNSFCQELIAYDDLKTLYYEELEFYNDYSSLLKSYILTNDEDSLKKYVELSEEFYSLECIFSEMVVESLFYWNYFRNYFDEESQVLLNKEIIYFWEYIKEYLLLDNVTFAAVNYVKSFSSFKNNDFEFKFPIQDFKIEKNIIEIKMPSEVFVRNDFYQTLAKAEFLLHQLNSEEFKLNPLLPENIFYEICNNPKLLYVIFNYEKYFLIQEFCIKAVKELFDYDFVFENNFESFYTIFPEGFFENVFSVFPDYQKNLDANFQYEFCNAFTKFVLKQNKEGFDITKIFSDSEIQIINLILENHYFAFCLESETLIELSEKFNAILNLDYFIPFVISNLKDESVVNE